MKNTPPYTLDFERALNCTLEHVDTDAMISAIMRRSDILTLAAWAEYERND